MKLWGKSHPESGPRDCPEDGWRVTPVTLCTRWTALWVALLEEHQPYNQWSRFERGPGGKICIYCLARGLAPGLNPKEGTCQHTHLSRPSPRNQGVREEKGVEHSAYSLTCGHHVHPDLGELLHSALRPNGARHEAGIKALWGQWSTNKSQVPWAQFALLSGVFLEHHRMRSISPTKKLHYRARHPLTFPSNSWPFSSHSLYATETRPSSSQQR